jgi:hypothetical protein
VLGQHLGDGRRQRGLAMVNVTNRPYVAVRLIPFKFFFRHFRFLSLQFLVTGIMASASAISIALPFPEHGQ